ncbi:LptF/LptG family permease [Ignavibacteria bacterium]|nr:LptF/LptG family permease [Bacteroidota bacterium]MCZ2132743.1 LptF/LptG family permease [Bacteroidota bacterium]
MKLLDRYILRSVISTLFFSLFALCVIFVVVDLIENLGDFLDHKAETIIIVEYYINYLPQIIKLLTPVATLLATLFAIGRLSNLNEITAMKSGGMSLYRLILPVFVFTCVLSAGQLYFNGWIVPKANTRKADIDRKFLQRGNTPGTVYNLYFRESPLRNVIMQYYDPTAKTGTQVVIEKYSSEMHPRLLQRIDAQRITWDTARNVWRLFNCSIRSVTPEGSNFAVQSEDTLSLAVSHEEIVELQRSPDQMNFNETRNYLAILEKGGKNIRTQLIDYYGQWAFPFANVIVALFAVPFASVRKKSGLAMEMAVAMATAFMYLIFTKVGQTLGSTLDVNAEIVGWAPNIIFFIIALFIIVRAGK